MGQNKDIELQELERSLLNSDDDDTLNTSNPKSNKPLPGLPSGQGSSHTKDYVKTVVYKGQELHILSKDWRDSRKLKGQILLSFYLFIIVGISDQTIGTLMPSLLKHYNTTQPTLSAVFILQFSGYAVSAVSNNLVHTKFGRAGAILIATGLHVMTSFVESTRPPLFIFMPFFFCYGLSVGLLDSGINVYLSSLVDHNEIMGFLHGFYGVGSVIGPPMASIILKIVNKGDDAKGGYGVHFFILGCLGLIGFVGAYIFFGDENGLKYEYAVTVEGHESDDESSFGVDDEQNGAGAEFDRDVSFVKLIKNPLIVTFCGYLFLYVGTEISIGTWLLSYLINVKSMDQITASFNVSWFWIGLTTGRMVLGFVTKFFKNEFRANFWYSFASLVTFVIYTLFLLKFGPEDESLGAIWFSVLNKILVFISGIFIGPLFPTSNVSLMKILPKHLHVAGVGIYSSLGGSGSAVLPYFVGLMVHWTSFVYFPIFICIGIASYVLNWWIIPKVCTIAYDF